MIVEEIRGIRSTRKDLRNFGLVVGGVFSLIGLALLWRGRPAGPYFCGGGSLLVAAGLLVPALLLPLQKAWMTLAVIMGWVMTRVILSVVFFLVLTPIGLVARIAGRRFLDRPPPPGTESYWNRRGTEEPDRELMEKQF